MEEQYFDEVEEKEVEELGISDKIVGVFAEPASMFTRLAQGQAKVTDWLLPLLLTIIVAISIQFVIASNPSLQQQAIQKQMEVMKENFDNMVENGQMTQSQADETMETMRDRMDQQMGAQRIIGTVAIVIMSFVVFFIVSAYFIFGSKLLFKGQATYKEGLSAYGLTGYITALQAIIGIVLIVVLDSINMGTNLASIMGEDVKELNGYLLSYIDPLKIWSFAVMSIGLAKVNKSESTGKYYGFVFGSWIVIGILFFFLTEAVPFMKSFIQ